MEYEDSEGHSHPLSREELYEVATWFTQPGLEVCGVIQGVEPLEEAEVVRRREAIMRDYEGTVFSETTPGNPPVRGPLGEAEIHLQPGAIPRKQRPFTLVGERRDATISILQDLLRQGKVEEGMSEWSSPAFPVPKSTPHTFRLVCDYRALNAVTETCSYPLPKIEEILQRQGNSRCGVYWT